MIHQKEHNKMKHDFVIFLGVIYSLKEVKEVLPERPGCFWTSQASAGKV